MGPGPMLCSQLPAPCLKDSAVEDCGDQEESRSQAVAYARAPKMVAVLRVKILSLVYKLSE